MTMTTTMPFGRRGLSPPPPPPRRRGRVAMMAEGRGRGRRRRRRSDTVVVDARRKGKRWKIKATATSKEDSTHGVDVYEARGTKTRTRTNEEGRRRRRRRRRQRRRRRRKQHRSWTHPIHSDCNDWRVLVRYHSAVINAPLAAIASDLGFAESDGLKGLVVRCNGVRRRHRWVFHRAVRRQVRTEKCAGVCNHSFSCRRVDFEHQLGRGLDDVWSINHRNRCWREFTNRAIVFSGDFGGTFRGTSNGLRRMAYVFGCLGVSVGGGGEEAADGGQDWRRPLFSDSVIPAMMLAVTALVVAVESPVWLLATSGQIECEEEKKESEREWRRSLEALMNIRGKAAKLWQENIQKKEERSGSSSNEGEVSTEHAVEYDQKVLTTSSSGSKEVSNSSSSTSGSGSDSSKKLETWSEIFEDKTNVPSLVTGVGLCALAAFSGSNTVIFYAKSVFSSVGLNSPELLTWAVGIPNIVGGILALVLTDKLGRRPLLLWSFGGMSACLVALSTVDIYTHGLPFLGGGASMTTSSKFFKASFCNTLDPSAVDVLSPEQKAKQRGSLSINEGYFSDIFDVQQSSYSFTTKSIICKDLPDREIGGLIEDFTIKGGDTTSGERQEPEATVALVSLPLYVLFFSAGAGPVPWLLYNEVFPTRIRAKAVSLCTATNYFSNAIVGAAFLPGVTSLGLGVTYAGTRC